jgi:hypothetical protein
MLAFERLSSRGADWAELLPKTLIVAGWTGRDEKALHHHIEELAAIGVPRPSSVPAFYRISTANLTQTARLEVLEREPHLRSGLRLATWRTPLNVGFWPLADSDATARNLMWFVSDYMKAIDFIALVAVVAIPAASFYRRGYMVFDCSNCR